MTATKFISLLTDFGLKDGYVGVMKGVIWRIAPDAQIADISHQISPQNVMEGALALGRVTHFFPDGSVHVGVVDPGVGTHRRPIAARIGKHYFVAPDNGLLSIVLKKAQSQSETIKIVHLDNPNYWLVEVSNVFHGRDIFAPAGAHLVNGVPLEDIGSQITDPILLDLPKPASILNGVQGQVITIDNFGNLSSNIQPKDLEKMGKLSIYIREQKIQGLVKTFGEQPKGTLVAIINSSGFLEVAAVNGNAAKVLDAQIGDPVKIQFEIDY